MREKILITGGAGFIGSALIKHLFGIDAGEIFVIDDLSFGNRNFITIDDEHFFQHDIRDLAALETSLKIIQPTVVFHLAAAHFIPFCNEHPYLASDINIRGTMGLYNALLPHKQLRKVFFASTAAVYPIYNDAITESHKTGPVDIYGLTKLACEELSERFHLLSKVPTCVLRFFNAFGPNETNAHLIPDIQKQINAGSRTIALGNTLPKRDFVHTSDMASALGLLMKKFDAGFNVFNLGRGEEYSVTDIVNAFSKCLNEQVEIRVDPAKVRKSDRLHLLSDIKKLKDFIGWQPKVSIAEGISTLVAKKNYIK